MAETIPDDGGGVSDVAEHGSTKYEEDVKGKVKSFSEKGFGFITADDGTVYFVYFQNVNREGMSLYVGEAVKFDVTTDPISGKSQAVNVTPIQ